MGTALLGLGSNIGDREENVYRALSLIGRGFPILDRSSLYETEPVGYTDQPPFLNMVVKIDAGDVSPHALLRFVKDAEGRLGRLETFRWGPRVIDIDILYMEGVDLCTEELHIPHRDLLNRSFVLVPLSEITDRILIGERNVFVRDRIESISAGHPGVTLYRDRSTFPI